MRKTILVLAAVVSGALVFTVGKSIGTRGSELYEWTREVLYLASAMWYLLITAVAINNVTLRIWGYSTLPILGGFLISLFGLYLTPAAELTASGSWLIVVCPLLLTGVGFLVGRVLILFAVARAAHDQAPA